MRVDFNNTYYKYPMQNAQTFKAYSLKPESPKFSFNPVMFYVNRLFSRSIAASRKRIPPISEKLKPYVSEIKLGDTYAWDINKDDRQKYLLVMHGTSQNVACLQVLYRTILEKTNYAIFAPEYRGFGKNQPIVLSKKTFLDDANSALDYLKEEKEIKPENISVLGYSFGGFVASSLVRENQNVERLILLSAIDSIGSSSIKIGGTSFKNKLPSIVRFFYKYLPLLKKPIAGILNTKRILRKTNVPIEIIHSKNDKMVDVSTANRLAKACMNPPNVTILPSGGHGMDFAKIQTIISILNKK